MSYLSQLYYPEKTDDSDYTYTAQGAPDINRLIKSLSYWKKPAPAQRQSKKALFVADPTLTNWPAEKITQLQEQLGKHIAAGFSVYLWQNGPIQELSAHSLSLLNDKTILNKITWVSPEELIAEAKKQHGIEHNKTHILHSLEMPRFMNDVDPEEPYFIDIDQIIKAKGTPQQLLPILSYLKRKIAYILHNQFSESANKLVNELKKILPEIPVKKEYCSAVLHCQLEDKQNTRLYGHDMDRADLRDLKRIAIDCLKNPLPIEDILSPIEALETLKLFHCKNEAPIDWSQLKLDKLKKLVIKGGSYKNLNIPELFKYAKNMETLELKGVGSLSVDKTDFSSLTSFHLDSDTGAVPLDFLQNVLQQTTKLECLNISHKNKYHTQLNSEISLPCLKTLALSKDIFQPRVLQNLIEKSRLQSLELYSIKNINKINFSKPDFSELKNLILDNCRISEENLHHILQQAQLNTLKVIAWYDTSKWTYYSNIRDLNQSQFASLTHLDLPKDSSEATQNVLSKAHMLQQITLHNVDLDWEKIDFTYVEEITFKDVTLSPSTLQQIITLAPRLKKLVFNHTVFKSDDTTFQLPLLPKLTDLEFINLDENQNIDQIASVITNQSPTLLSFTMESSYTLTADWSQYNFAHVKKINLYNMQVTLDLFKKITTEAPNLEELSLSSINHSFTEYEQIDLPKLKNLTLSFDEPGSNNYHIVKVLLYSISNLENLNLQYIGDLNEIDWEEVKLTTLNKLDISSSRISSKNFSTLLDQAPNLKEIDVGDTCIIEGTSIAWNKIPASIKNLFFLKTEVEDSDEDDDEKEDEDKNDIQEEPLEVPSHDRDSQLKFRPQSAKTFQFNFSGKNKTYNQNMVLEKLSQYLTLKQQHADVIYKLQDGICLTLVKLFLENDWPPLIKRIRDWDGTNAHLTQELEQDFNKLFRYADKYTLQNYTEDELYLGNNLRFLLENAPRSMVLSNPWHAIGLKYISEQNCWLYYDPNSPNPHQIIKQTDSGHLDQLVELIHQSLGPLVSVNDVLFVPNVPYISGIANPEQFVHEGGLFALVYAKNNALMLQHLQTQDNYSEESLEGLLVRNMAGVPAWCCGLEHEIIREYTANLIHQFAAHYPDDHYDQLAKSLKALTEEEQKVSLSLLEQINIYPVPEEAEGEEEENKYEAELETWTKHKRRYNNPQKYYESLIFASTNKKQLIEVSGNELSLELELLRRYHAMRRAVYCINSPDDLVCSAPFVQREGDKGVINKGPGGPLYDFLKKHERDIKPPIIIVNYANFKADDVVSSNSMLDKDRKIEGIPIPDHAQVIGIMNPEKTDSYQGKDFYSRFDQVESCPFSTEQPRDLFQKIDLNDSLECYDINLGHAKDWKERLLGRWIIHKDELLFEEGELCKALQSGLPIRILNGLWKDESFLFFWQEAQIRGKIEYAGSSISLPKNQIFYCSEGYDWQKLSSRLRFSQVPGKPFVALNSEQLTSFYWHYLCDNEQKTLDMLPGLLKQHANQTIRIHVTRNLSLDEWGLLLSECEKHHVTLECQKAPGVTLPAPLDPLHQAKEYLQKSSHLQAIISTDPAVTINKIIGQEKDWLVVDISECQTADLLIKLGGKLNKDTLKFEFNQQKGLIREALAKNKKILLHGQFSAELMDHLASILTHGELENKFVLISKTHDFFNYLPTAQHEVSVDEKISCLDATQQEIAYLYAHTDFNKESYSRLQARLRYLRAFYGDASHWTPELVNKPWEGMERAAVGFNFPEFNLQRCQEIAKNFDQKRLTAVIQLLRYSPFVFLSGPTSVGKSTFVTEVLAKQPNTKIHYGETRMREWAEDITDGDIFLFIDEANISSRQWSEIQGLFNQPPSIVIDGICYPLTKRHKIIFAGNPLSYGGDRQKASLFSEHGNAILFEPMPLEYIYEYLLKPAVAGTVFEQELPSLAQPILDVYRFICSYSKDKILISPRELQMMLLLTLASDHPSPETAKYHAYQLAKNLVPEPQKALFAARFKMELPRQEKTIDHGDYLMTPSRQVIKNSVEDLMKLRALRRQTNNETQQHGGLGGLIMEGDSGIGKSDLLEVLLAPFGYTKDVDLNKKNGFYSISARMHPEQKKELLLKAFDEGAVVLIDEINTSPMMERLLNDLLMGKTPDNKRPTKPGFLVFGTQNPSTEEGRKNQSTALARRLMIEYIPPYSTIEMQSILVKKGIQQEEAPLMVQAYEKKLKQARQEHLKPEPTFRDLIRLAEKILTKSKRTIQKKEIPVIIGELHQHIATLQAEMAEPSSRNVRPRFFPGHGSTNLEIHALRKAIDILQGKNPDNVADEEIEVWQQEKIKKILGLQHEFLMLYPELPFNLFEPK